MIKDLSKFKNQYVLLAIALFILFVGLVVRFLTLPAGNHSQEEAMQAQLPVTKDDGVAKVQDESKAEDADILYIKDGDLWQSDSIGKSQIKLIDRDEVHDAKISPDGKSIAYTLSVTKKDTVKTYEGKTEERDFTRTKLFLADNKGANSYAVKDGVVRWGWIPSANLLWYESDALTQLFDWGYYGNQDIWIFDPVSKQARMLVQDAQILNPIWSPDGTKLSYVGYRLGEDNSYKNLLIRLIDLKSSEMKDLFDVPYVGGDRGGPPPVPTVYWSKQGDALYTAFTAMIWDGNNYGNKFTSGYLSVWKIPTDGSTAIKLAPEVPAQVTNDETNPRVIFNEDFSKVVYTRLKEKDIAGKNPSDWYYVGDYQVSLAVYDMKVKAEKILVEDFNPENASTFISEDSLYLFTKVGNETVIRKIDLSSGGMQEFKTGDYADQHGVEVIGQLKKQGFVYLKVDSPDAHYYSVVVFDETSGIFKTMVDKAFNVDFYRK